MIFACNGYTVDFHGPCKANTLDAEVMQSLFQDGSPLRSYFSDDDVFILDRGFRDSIRVLKECM